MQTRVVLNKEEKETLEKFVDLYCDLKRTFPLGCYLFGGEDYLDLNDLDIDIVSYIYETEYLIGYEEK